MKLERNFGKNAMAAALAAVLGGDLPPAYAQDLLKPPGSRMARDAKDFNEKWGGYVSELPKGTQEFTRERIQSLVPPKGAYLGDLVKKIMSNNQEMQDYDASKESLFGPDQKVVYVEYTDAPGKFYYRIPFIGRFQADVILHETTTKDLQNNVLANIRAIHIVPNNWIQRSR